MIIDTHQHFWKYDPSRDSWMDDSMDILKKDFLPTEAEAVARRNGVEKCIAIQADQSEEETRFLLDLAEASGFVCGVVGWLDLRAPSIEARLAHFSSFGKLCGFRHIVQGEADVNFLLRPEFMNGISFLERYGFTYDILVFPHQLGAVLELVRCFPQQRFVIDHLAKPYIKDGFFDGWANQMRAIGKHENVYCKVSGLVTEADWGKWEYVDFVPYLDVVWETFGSRRLMFGSDYPVCLLGGEYREVKSIADTYSKAFSMDEQTLFWEKNAMEFYQILKA